MRRLCNPTADFLDEVNGLLAPGSRRLYRYRYEVDACCDVMSAYFCDIFASAAAGAADPAHVLLA